MVVWSIDDAPLQRPSTSGHTEQAQIVYLRAKRLDALADARSWGFGHGVRRPRTLFQRDGGGRC